jgi:hypothetical protein
MKHDKIILTDCDGVCLDWESHFHEWASDRGLNRVQHGIYEIPATYNMSKERARELVNDFNTSSHILTMPAFRDARSGIATLVERGWRFIAITSVSDDPVVAKLRTMNLEYLFGGEAFIDVQCLEMGIDKDEALMPYMDSGMWWIEDKDINAITGANMGLNTILMDHLHNKHVSDPRIKRVENWAQIVDVIDGSYSSP